MMNIKEVLLQWFINFLIAKSSVGATTLANRSAFKHIISRRITQTSIRKFKKRKVYSSLIDSIWGANLVKFNMQI